MRKLTLALLSLLPLTATAADIRGNYAIWGVGMTTCNQYIIAREANEDGPYKQYMMGYLTAFNSLAEDTYRISGERDLNDILKWMDDTCTANRVHGFETSLKMFTEVHYQERQKTPPSTSKKRGW